MVPFCFCPCGRQTVAQAPLAYAACCARFLEHVDTTPAPDAQSLLRSRYSAFVLGRIDYLLATWHPSTRPGDVAVDDGTRWWGLTVRRHTVIDAHHAQVEFVARYRPAGGGGRAERLQACREFVRDTGRWLYLDDQLA